MWPDLRHVEDGGGGTTCHVVFFKFKLLSLFTTSGVFWLLVEEINVNRKWHGTVFLSESHFAILIGLKLQLRRTSPWIITGQEMLQRHWLIYSDLPSTLPVFVTVLSVRFLTLRINGFLGKYDSEWRRIVLAEVNNMARRRMCVDEGLRGSVWALWAWIGLGACALFDCYTERLRAQSWLQTEQIPRLVLE